MTIADLHPIRPSVPGDRAGRPPYARFLRGREADGAWVRPALLGLLLATGFLYLWGLGASGWANSYYSASVQAGSESWQAMFFGSSDAANSITVDKTPASLWVMSLAGRLFGVNAWSVLVPQALEGIATVGVLYLVVRRRFPAWAGLLAGLILALTPIAALMFRFNNPDALLVLLITLAAYAVLRAQEHASTRWLVLAGALVGFGFLTKMLQAFLIVPAFALVYLVLAPTGIWRRVRQLLWSGLALILAGGWWIAIVELWPDSSRPYIGGSPDNSILELTLGYNGLSRLNGEGVGGPGGAGGPGGPGGPGRPLDDTGWDRLFDVQNGGQISWLLPTALILLVGALWATRRAPRTDPARAAVLLCGGWLLTTAIVFSYMGGIFHAYYDVALAPGIAALIAMGAALLWKQRDTFVGALVMASAVAAGAWWAYRLLDRTPDWFPWLRHTVLVGGMAAAVALFVIHLLDRRLARRCRRPLVHAVAGVAILALLAGPTAYTWDTVRTPHGGSIPSAGPSQGLRPGMIPGPGPGRPGSGPQGRPPAGPNGAMPPPGMTGRPPGGGPAPGAPPPGLIGPRGVGGLLNGSKPGKEVVKLLKRDSDDYSWVAAAVGSNKASGYQLETGKPVMPLGGFNGSDPSPTLAEFRKLVADGRIHYFIGGTGPGMRSAGGSGEAESIAAWVEQTYASTTVDGVTLHDLTAPPLR